MPGPEQTLKQSINQLYRQLHAASSKPIWSQVISVGIVGSAMPSWRLPLAAATGRFVETRLLLRAYVQQAEASKSWVIRVSKDKKAPDAILMGSERSA